MDGTYHIREDILLVSALLCFYNPNIRAILEYVLMLVGSSLQALTYLAKLQAKYIFVNRQKNMGA